MACGFETPGSPLMARIVVITHTFDRLTKRRFFRPPVSRYMICGVLSEMSRRGHSWTVARGVDDRKGGDLAFLHADATLTPPELAEYGRRFPVCLNLRVSDISKRKISNVLLERGDAWSGPVIVKTNLNHCGFPEERLNRRARWRFRRPPFPGVRGKHDYEIFDSLSAVPTGIFDDPDLVVERFLAEREVDGFALRNWVFCGDYNYGGRWVAQGPMVKGATVFRHELCAIPESLRKRREELGFDYGKFDFAVHDGQAFLLDANKTPGLIPPGGASLVGLADGLERIVRSMRE